MAHHDLTDREAADLAALADGRLRGRRRRRAERRVAEDPRLAAALERQRRGRDAITATAASAEAPAALRGRVEALAAEHGREDLLGHRGAPRLAAVPARRRTPVGERLRLRPGFAFAGMAGVTAAVVLIVVVVTGGARLTVRETVAAALRPAAAGVEVDRTQPRLLRAAVDGVPFPNFATKFGWRATGERTDVLDGRTTRTVFYARGGRRIAYTIVEGEALPPPPDTTVTVRDGVRLRPFAERGREAVTWRRSGQTCVLSGAGLRRAELLELAAWKGMGAVPF